MIFLTPMVKKASKAITNNKFKKLSLAVGLSCTLMSQQVLALTLSSEPNQESVHIFQPLDIKIEIIDRDDEVAIDDVFINMASQRSFDRFGLVRNNFLSKLTIKWDETEEGVKFVHITSRELVKEPFLMFLLEVSWPNGHLFKDYTLLFDAPLTQQRNQQAALQFATNPNPVISEPAQVNNTNPQPIVVESKNTQYLVKDTDTLWEIAVKTKPQDNITVQQMMLSIQDKNPNAFVNNNINILKSGVLLDIPTTEEALIRSRTEANQEVYAQSNTPAPEPIVVKDKTVSELPSTQPEIIESIEIEPATEKSDDEIIEKDETRPQLRLVTSDDGLLDDLSVSGNQDAVIDSLENDLAIALDQVEKEQRDNAEKRSTISELEVQNETLNKILDLKSQELAELQRQLKAQDLNETVTDVIDATDVDVNVDVDVVTDIEVSNDAQSLSEVDDLIGYLEVDEDSQSVIDNVQTTAPEEIEPVVEAKPELVPAEVESQNIVSKYIDAAKTWILKSPLNMAITGVSGLLLLILLLALFTKKRNKESNDDYDEDLPNIDDINLNDEIDDDLLSDIDLDSDEFAGFDDGALEEIDALEEAQKSIGYGDLNQAITILEAGYKMNSERDDIAVKLLDLYGQTEQNDKFADLEARASINATSSLLSQIAVLSEKYNPEQSSTEESVNNSELDTLNFDALESEELPQEESLDIDIDALSMEIDDNLMNDSTDLEIESDDLELDVESEDLDIDFDIESNSDDLDIELDIESDNDDLDLDVDLENSDEFEITLDDLETTDISEEKEESNEFEIEMDSDELETLEIDIKDEQDVAEQSFDFSMDELDSEIAELDAQFSTVEETESNLDVESMELEEIDLDTSKDEDEDEAPSMTAEDVDNESELDDDIETEIDFMGDNDENSTKLNLAKAFVEMGDNESAKEMLEEIVEEGNDEQKTEAQQMIDSL